MGADYIPTRDAAAANWMRVFADGIAAAPERYMLAPADAASISRAAAEFAEALAVAVAPATRTKGAVAAKDRARYSAERLLRLYAGQIKANLGISVSDKIAIGVPIPNPTRTPIDVPASSPLLNVLGAKNTKHELTYNDSTAPTRRAKPFGATCLQLFVAVSDGPVRDPGAASFYGAFTSSPVTVDFESRDGGKYATYFGRWASRRGDVGPWSLPVGMHVAA